MRTYMVGLEFEAEDDEAALAKVELVRERVADLGVRAPRLGAETWDGTPRRKNDVPNHETIRED